LKQSLLIRVDYIAPSLNAIYAGIHYRKRKQIADTMHMAVKVAVRRCKPFTGAVTIDYMPMIKGRRYDTDNYALTGKGILDGLVTNGIIEKDTAEIVKRVTYHAPESIKKPEQSHMIVVITEV